MEKCALVCCIVMFVVMLCKFTDGSCFVNNQGCTFKGIKITAGNHYTSMKDCIRCTCSSNGASMQCCSIGFRLARPAPAGCKIVKDSGNPCTEKLVKASNANELCDEEAAAFAGR